MVGPKIAPLWLKQGIKNIMLASNMHSIKKGHHGRFVSISGQHSHGCLQWSMHFTCRILFLCLHATPDTLQFFSFRHFPTQNSHTHQWMNMVFSYPSAIFSPTAPTHQTHISPTVAPPSATAISTTSLGYFFSHVAAINGHKHMNQWPSWCYQKSVVRSSFQLLCQWRLPFDPTASPQKN